MLLADLHTLTVGCAISSLGSRLLNVFLWEPSFGSLPELSWHRPRVRIFTDSFGQSYIWSKNENKSSNGPVLGMGQWPATTNAKSIMTTTAVIMTVMIKQTSHLVRVGQLMQRLAGSTSGVYYLTCVIWA